MDGMSTLASTPPLLSMDGMSTLAATSPLLLIDALRTLAASLAATMDGRSTPAQGGGADVMHVRGPTQWYQDPQPTRALSYALLQGLLYRIAAPRK